MKRGIVAFIIFAAIVTLSSIARADQQAKVQAITNIDDDLANTDLEWSLEHLEVQTKPLSHISQKSISLLGNSH